MRSLAGFQAALKGTHPESWQLWSFEELWEVPQAFVWTECCLDQRKLTSEKGKKEKKKKVVLAIS